MPGWHVVLYADQTFSVHNLTDERVAEVRARPRVDSVRRLPGGAPSFVTDLDALDFSMLSPS